MSSPTTLPVDQTMIDHWRANYGLDTRSPADAMRVWHKACNGMAPAGCVAALGIALIELDRLRALDVRLSAAPVAIIDTRVALALCAPTEDELPALYALQGRRVALVDLDSIAHDQTARMLAGD